MPGITTLPKMHRLICLFFITLFSGVYAINPEPYYFGPEVKFDRISIEQGLSENVILTVETDKYGFIWLGTQAGLNRYDGYKIKIYRNDPDDNYSISNSYISCLFSDEEGNLWIGTANGLNRYDHEHDLFIHYFYDSDDITTLCSNNITAIFEDRKGNLWIGTDMGLNLLNKQSNSFSRYTQQENSSNCLSRNHIRALADDKNGFLWIGTEDGGLNSYNIENDIFRHYTTDSPTSFNISGNQVLTVKEDQAGFLWIGTNNGLDRISSDLNHSTHFQKEINNSNSLSHNFVNHIFQDSKGQLWISTNSGLNLLKPDNSTFTHFFNQSHNLSSLSANLILSATEDPAGILLFATEDGLSKLDPLKQKFLHYKHNSDDEKSLSNNVVSAILVDREENLWVGTLGKGLNRYDHKIKGFVHYILNPSQNGTLSDNIVYSIFQDSKDRVWVGTQNGGLNLYHRETDSFTHFKGNPDGGGLSSDFIFPVIEDRKGRMWAGTWGGGLNRFDPETGHAVIFKHDPLDSESISNDIISTILEDDKGYLWLSTFQGLNKFNPETGKSIRYLHDDKDSNTLSNNTAITLHMDKKGYLWIGTLNGLNRLDIKTGTFRHFGIKDGMPSEVITCIEEDEEGNLWLASFNGLTKFNPDEEVFHNYNTDDGLQSRRFRTNASFRSKDGLLFFGGINGFNVFKPGEIKDNQYLAPVVITEFLLFNQPQRPASSNYLKKSVFETQEIRLDYKQSVFSFEFSSLHYSDPEVIRYAYMLEGFDKEWRYTDADKRFAVYTNLDGGNYTFKVKATNCDNVWNETPTTLRLIISPPFWKTIWFYLLLVFISLMIIGITIAYLVKLNYEISERKHSERILSDVIEKNPLSIQIADAEGYTIQVNPSYIKLFGLNPTPEYNVFNDNQLEEQGLNSLIVAARKGEIVYFPEILYKINAASPQIDQDYVWIKMIIFPLIGIHEKPDQYVIMYEDITRRKLTEDEREKLRNQLVHAQKMESVGRLAGGVAHDFNNMLGVIIGYTELIINELAPDSQYYQNLQEVLKAAKRSADLTRQLLTFARKQTISPKILNLNDTVNGMYRMLKRLIGENILLLWMPAEKPVMVEADPSQIDQILANLCVNARDAITDTGKIIIETELITLSENFCIANTGATPGDYVLLKVSDSGYGMDKETLSHLFEPFFTTKDPGKGTGLGLATVYGIIRQNNGYINVHSQPGAGTTFNIYLPEYKKTAEDVPLIQTDKKSFNAHGTILVLEDEAAILNMTTKILAAQGYKLLSATSPAEALHIAREHEEAIHLLITDVIMPEMNGRELSAQIINLRPQIKVLFMSGYTADVITFHGVLDKQVNFIQKPFTLEELVSKVREVIELSEK